MAANRWKFKYYFRVKKFDKISKYEGFTEATVEDLLQFPNYPAIQGDYMYICDRHGDFIQKRTFPEMVLIQQLGTTGSGDDQFHDPAGAACDGANLYIVDLTNNRIIKRLTSDLSYVSEIGTMGQGNDQFLYPEGICTDGNYIYITDSSNDRIFKRTLDLAYISKTGGSGDNQFNSPRGIAICNGFLYIIDSDNHRIQKRKASDLSFVSKIGGYGTGDDQFHSPAGIACDGFGSIYVTDSYNSRIMKRTETDLSFISKIGEQGDGDDQFYQPRGIAFSENRLIIGDSVNSRIQKRKAIDLSYEAQTGISDEGKSANGKSWVKLKSIRARYKMACYSITLKSIGSWAGTPKFRLTVNDETIYPGENGETIQSGVKVEFPGPLAIPTGLFMDIEFRSTSVSDGASQRIALTKLDTITNVYNLSD